MALTINTQPSGLKFAYRPLNYKITSDSTAIVRAIADVYIGGSWAGALENSPILGTTNQFTFDLQGITQDNLTNILLSKNTGLVGYGDTLTADFFEVTEAAGLFTTAWADEGAGTPDVSSLSSNPINGALVNGEANAMTNYVQTGTYAYLSKNLDVIKIKKGDPAMIVSVNTGVAAFGYALRVKQYDSNGTLISNTTPVSLATSKVVAYGVYDSSSVLSNTDYFTLTIEDTGTPLTKELRFNLVEDVCNDYTSIYWINSVGGVDYHLFEGNKKKKIRSKINSFRKNITDPSDITQRGLTTLNVESFETYEIYTGKQTAQKIQHLAELSTHKTDVFFFDGSNFVPINILSTSKKISDAMDSVNEFKITYELSNTINSKRN